MKIIKKTLIDIFPVYAHTYKGDIMNNKNKQENKKTATNNQWTNNNLKYYPDKRERKDGPGGESNSKDSQT